MSDEPPPEEHLSIGEVLALLQEEFPDCTISKIRFLESQGLIRPDRTASGYRKFYAADIERLRWILRQQRDHFLPLKVLRRMLDEGIDRFDPGGGDQPTLFTPTPSEVAAEVEGGSATTPVAATAGASATGPGATARSPRHPAVASAPPRPGPPPSAVPPAEPATRPGGGGLETPADVVAALQEDPRQATGRAGGGRRRSRTGGSGGNRTERAASAETAAGESADEQRTAGELCAAVGIDEDLLRGLERFGLVVCSVRGGEAVYGPDAAAVCRLAARYAQLGVEPRHLRMYLVAAEREAGFVEQLAVPLLKQRNPAAREQARALARELEGMGAELHALLLRRELGPDLGA